MAFRYQPQGAVAERGPTTATEVLAQWPRQARQPPRASECGLDDTAHPFGTPPAMTQDERDGALMDATLAIAEARSDLASHVEKRQALARKVDDPALAGHPSRPAATERLTALRAEEDARLADLLRLAFEAQTLWRDLDGDYKLFGPYIEAWSLEEVDDVLYGLLFWCPLDGSRAMPVDWRLDEGFWTTHDATWIGAMRPHLVTW